MALLRVSSVATFALIFVLTQTAVVADEPVSRIVRGHNANDGQFPYQVYIRINIDDNKIVLGGGSVIGQEWVITAAHVVYGHATKDISLLLGALYVSSPERTVVAERVVMYPGWHPSNIHNDIALVRIPRVNYSNKIQPVRLPSIGDKSDFAGEWATITGWGGTSDGSLPDRMQYGYVQIISQDECSRKLTLEPTMICATSTGSGFCGGDSGGPMVLYQNLKLVGIISFGVNGCDSGLPNGYTRVTSFVEWIRDNTGIAY